MRISQETIEQVKDRADILEVVEDFIQLKKSGSTYRAKSPFTTEKTPSFFVVPHKGIFKDFSSGKAGDAIKFVMEYDGLNYIEAIRYLAGKYGIEIKDSEPSQEELLAFNERESLFVVLNYAKEVFKKNLFKSDEGKSIGLSYFKERGITDASFEKFELGYSLEKWDDLLTKAQKAGYKADLLEKAGLISRKDERTYDRFRARVIFPIHNSTGKTIAFGARTLSSDKKQPKYLNSPETDVYHKSKILYGIFQARKAIRRHDKCYLVEGYTDVIGLHQAGVENVVSSSGTALTVDQIKLISRHTNNITVLFDGDEAGIRASLRGIDMILEEGLNVRCVSFPEGEDPDSYSRKVGALTFVDYLEKNEEDFIVFKTNIFASEAKNDPIKRADAINNLVESISKIPDPVKRAVYLKETSDLLDMQESVLIAEMNKILLSQSKRDKKRENIIAEERIQEELEQSESKHQPSEKVNSLELQERECVKILINYGFNEIEDKYNLIDHYIEELEGMEFQNSTLNELMEIFRNEVDKGNILSLDDFYKIGPDHLKKELLMHFDSIQYTVSDNWQKHKIFPPNEYTPAKSAYLNILRLKFRKIRSLFKLNQEEMQNAQSEDEINEHLKIAIELKKTEKEFAEPLGITIA